jgi:hypothetical protein
MHPGVISRQEPVARAILPRPIDVLYTSRRHRKHSQDQDDATFHLFNGDIFNCKRICRNYLRLYGLAAGVAFAARTSVGHLKSPFYMASAASLYSMMA